MKTPVLLLTATLTALCATAQVHKEYPAGVFPDRIALGWKDNKAATTQSVSWRTDTTVTAGIGMITEANPTPDLAATAVSVQALTEKATLEGKGVHSHTAHFSGLKPGTLYSYRVGDGSHWSEWFQFRTAQEGAAPFSFLYFGDAQIEIRSLWSRTIRGAYSAMPKADLLIHAGDLITTANADWQWGEWFEASGWINGVIPVLATPGNHEYFKGENGKRRISPHWRPSFVLPENGPSGMEERAYYLDYQGVRFVSLDSEGALQDKNVMAKQSAWLEGVLKDNPSKWTIVVQHHPVYSTKNGRDNEDWRAEMEPIFKKYKVDLVLQGHDHTYARGINMPVGVSRKNPDGPVYVVSVSGGKMYDIGLQDWMDRAASNTQLYQTVEIDGQTLAYQSYTVTGQLYDSFRLTKNASGKNTLTDLAPKLMPELLDLPPDYQRRYKPEQKEEYQNRFEAYKKRKASRKK